MKHESAAEENYKGVRGKPIRVSRARERSCEMLPHPERSARQLKPSDGSQKLEVTLEDYGESEASLPPM